MTRTAPLTSTDKLNKMIDLFTKGDNGKLDRAETDALAGYYGGLPDAGKAKVKARLVEVYQTSTFAGGQRDRFRDALTAQGLPLRELEGVAGDTGATILKMSKGAQLETLSRFDTDEGGGGDGFSKTIRPQDAARDAGAKIKAALGAFDKKLTRDNAGDESFALGDKQWRALYREPGAHGRGQEVLGYAVTVPIYANDHDVDQALYFNIKGEQVGKIYVGE
jgi:hypothetical protein